MFFAFVVYTDYNVGTYYGFYSTGTVTSNLTDLTYPQPGGLGASFGPATATETTYSKGPPSYRLPIGYEFPGYDHNSGAVGTFDLRPKINDVGANKIQQTYLYKIENLSLIHI